MWTCLPHILTCALRIEEFSLYCEISSLLILILPTSKGHMGAIRECWHEGSSCEYSYIYMLCIFCRYTNRDYVKLRTVRIRLDIYRERRNLCHATGANPVSPKLFGSCFILWWRIWLACIISYHEWVKIWLMANNVMFLTKFPCMVPAC